MLSSAILYFSSTSAQVWAAFMVFHILLVRDQMRSLDDEFDRQWHKARELWHEFLVGFQPSDELDAKSVTQADTRRDAFVRTILAIRRHKLVLKVARATTWRGLPLSAEALQGKLNPIAARVEQIEQKRELWEPFAAFKIGIIAVALNLAVLGLAALFEGNPIGLWLLISLLAVFNSWQGYVFFDRVRGALRES